MARVRCFLAVHEHIHTKRCRPDRGSREDVGHWRACSGYSMRLVLWSMWLGLVPFNKRAQGREVLSPPAAQCSPSLPGRHTQFSLDRTCVRSPCGNREGCSLRTVPLHECEWFGVPVSVAGRAGARLRWFLTCLTTAPLIADFTEGPRPSSWDQWVLQQNTLESWRRGDTQRNPHLHISQQ